VRESERVSDIGESTHSQNASRSITHRASQQFVEPEHAQWVDAAASRQLAHFFFELRGERRAESASPILTVLIDFNAFTQCRFWPVLSALPETQADD
jgi:hypothetical protein